MVVVAAATLLEERQDDSPLGINALQALTGISVEEFLALPEVKPALEYVEGSVTQKVSPKGRHSVLQASLTDTINRIARPNKLALAFPELRFSGMRHSEVPDVSVYGWERIPRSPDGVVADDFWDPPDIAMEILSPRQSRRLQAEKCQGYLRRGVQAALLIDADRNTVTVFRPGHHPLTLRAVEYVELGDIVPGLRFSVAELFNALRID